MSLDITSLVDAIADAIVAKLVESGAVNGEPPPQTVPAKTVDKPAKASKKAAPEPEEEPEDEEPEEEADEEEEDEESDDLVTPEQLAAVEETAEEAEIDTARSELLDFHVLQGNKKKEVAAILAEMSDEEIKKEYADYLARLLVADEDGNFDFASDMETPYQAIRIFDGEEVVKWVRGGLTLSDEEVAELGLDAEEEEEEEEPAPPPKKLPPKKAAAKEVPQKRTRTPGKK